MGRQKLKTKVSKNKAVKTARHLVTETGQLRDQIVKLISENRKLNKYVQTQWCVCGRAASLHIGQDLKEATPPCTGFMAIREKTFQAYKLGLAVTLKLDPDKLTPDQEKAFREYFDQELSAQAAAEVHEAKLAGDFQDPGKPAGLELQIQAEAGTSDVTPQP